MKIDDLFTTWKRDMLRAPADEAGGGDTTTTNDTPGEAGDGKTEDGNGTEGAPKGVIDAEAGDGGTDDANKDGEEATEEAAGGDTVPADGKYEFELPEGVELSDEDRTTWSDTFKDLGLTTGQAQKLIARQVAMMEADAQNTEKAIVQRMADDLKAAKADKEIGGDKWDTTVGHIKSAYKVIGGTALRDLIVQSGRANDPEIIREMARIGARIGDDSFDPSNPANAQPASLEDRWYGAKT